MYRSRPTCCGPVSSPSDQTGKAVPPSAAIMCWSHRVGVDDLKRTANDYAGGRNPQFLPPGIFTPGPHGGMVGNAPIFFVGRTSWGALPPIGLGRHSRFVSVTNSAHPRICVRTICGQCKGPCQRPHNAPGAASKWTGESRGCLRLLPAITDAQQSPLPRHKRPDAASGMPHDHR